MLMESLFERKIPLFFAPDEGGGGAGGADPSEGGGEPPKTFSQEQVNTMMASEKRSGRLSLLKELGYEVKEGTKISEVISTVKGILDSSKTQQQLDQEAKANAENDLANERIKNSSLMAQIEMMKAGVKSEYVNDAITILTPQITEQKPLSKLLEEYKSKYPTWFGESGEGSKGTGGPNNPPRKTGNNTEGLGKRLAQANKSATKSSFFNN